MLFHQKNITAIIDRALRTLAAVIYQNDSGTICGEIAHGRSCDGKGESAPPPCSPPCEQVGEYHAKYGKIKRPRTSYLYFSLQRNQIRQFFSNCKKLLNNLLGITKKRGNTDLSTLHYKL